MLTLSLPGVCSLPLTDRDEARYVGATREMLDSGDYVDIRFHQSPRYLKPIGIYWLQALSVKILGDNRENICAYRAPSLLGAWIALLALFTLAFEIGGMACASIACALLAATILFGFEARLAKTDTALLAAITTAQAALAQVFLKNGREASRVNALLFWIACGAGILIKGPVLPLVIALTAAALWGYERSAVWMRALFPFQGALVLCLIVAPWFCLIQVKSEGQFLHSMFGEDIFPKMISGHQSHGYWPGTYLLALPFLFWPSSLFLPLAVRELYQSRGDRAGYFLAAWIIPSFVFFECMPTKQGPYLLPLFPPLAIAIAAAIKRRDRFLDSRWVFAWGAISLLCAGGVILLSQFFGQPLTIPTYIFCALAALGLSAFLLAVRRASVCTYLSMTVFPAAFVFPLFLYAIAPNLAPLWVSARVKEAVDALKPKGAPIVSGYLEPSIVTLMGKETRFAEGSDAADLLALSCQGAAIIERSQLESFLNRTAQEQRLFLKAGEVLGYNSARFEAVSFSIFINTCSEQSKLRGL